MSTLTVTRISHACVLLDFNGFKVLTDPWFSEKWGYYRGEPLGITVDKLPSLDLILVSHAHYDHYDTNSLKSYPDKKVPWIVRKGIGQKAREAGFENIVELDHWEEHTLHNMRITATPAKHKIPENTYMLEIKGMNLFFGADTLFIPELVEVGLRWPIIDVALLPVNGLSIRPLFNRQVVMNAYEASLLCAVLKPRIAIPIHYAFTAGFIRDQLLLKYNGTAGEFYDNVSLKVPQTKVNILAPGKSLKIEYHL